MKKDITFPSTERHLVREREKIESSREHVVGGATPSQQGDEGSYLLLPGILGDMLLRSHWHSPFPVANIFIAHVPSDPAPS